MGKRTNFPWPFSIAMLNYQRVPYFWQSSWKMMELAHAMKCVPIALRSFLWNACSSGSQLRKSGAKQSSLVSATHSSVEQWVKLLFHESTGHEVPVCLLWFWASLRHYILFVGWFTWLSTIRTPSQPSSRRGWQRVLGATLDETTRCWHLNHCQPSKPESHFGDLFFSRGSIQCRTFTLCKTFT